MRIQRIQASDMQTALEQVRGRLGPDAVIISTRGLGSTYEERRRGLSGIEVVAGVEPEPATSKPAAAKAVPANNVAAAAARAAYAGTTTATAPTETPTVAPASPTAGGAGRATTGARGGRAMPVGIPVSVTSAGTVSTPRFPRVNRFGDPLPERDPEPATPPAARPTLTATAPETEQGTARRQDEGSVLRGLRRLGVEWEAPSMNARAPVVNYVPGPSAPTAAHAGRNAEHAATASGEERTAVDERRAQRDSQSQSAAHRAAEHVYDLLLSAGLAESLVESALEQAIGMIPVAALGDRDRLLEVTLSRLVAGLPAGPSLNGASLAGKAVFVAGGAGTGKTTALLKAARHLHQSGVTVRIVAADISRIGATEHLQRYGDLLGLTVEVAYTAEDAARILADLPGDEVALVDTPACRVGAAAGELDDDLLALLDAAPERLVVLTTAAGAGEAELCRLAITAKALKADAVVLTRMDEAVDPRSETARPIGAALNVAALLGLPPLFTTGGRDILDAISTPSAVDMAVEALEAVTAAGIETDR
jgi:flagellar biosynthesis protein FlhF